VQIFHVTSADSWAAAVPTGQFEWSTAGKTLAQVGFIHASTAEQVGPTAKRVYGTSADDLVVLVLDEQVIKDAGTDVVFEDGGNGQLYPHIYGPVLVEWVQEVRRAKFDASGTFTF